MKGHVGKIILVRTMRIQGILQAIIPDRSAGSLLGRLLVGEEMIFGLEDWLSRVRQFLS